ncbi:glutathionylspermidine synthase family protein, partial [Salmonella enterica]|uniref:glutathionylspermidine synthase family protein n=1 Tax=Salmonella enterica TaxID=28901 RepID=UPI00043710B1
FQWLWLEDARRSGAIPRDADQYNAIQERLIARFSELYSREPLYFCCCEDTDEDRTTVLYLQDCAQQAGQETRFIKKELISPLSPYSLGGIWAAHIALKYPALGHYDFSFLLISLLSVLFIGSIAFAANIVAFTLYSLPPVAVCLWLNGNE